MAKHYQGSPVTTTTDQHFIPEIWADGIYKYFEHIIHKYKHHYKKL